MDKQPLLDAYHLNVFTSFPYTGNSATVIVDSVRLQARQMQQIATECSTPESVFVQIHKQQASLRFFTPQEEVPSCGHGTLAALYVLHKLGVDVTPCIRTAVGTVNVKIEKQTNTVFKISTPELKVEPILLPKETLSELFIGASEDNFSEIFAVKNQSGGRRFLIQMATPEDVDNLQPDFARIQAFQRQHKISGCFCFAPKGSEFDTFNGRMFAPAIGINEDPVNGNSSTALGAVVDFLSKSNGGHRPSHIKVYQGMKIKRPGVVDISLTDNGDIEMSGQVTQVFQFQLSAPDAGKLSAD